MKKFSKILAVVIVFTVVALCLVACKPSGKLHEHNFGTTWESSSTEHWHECSCGEKKDVAGHIDENNDDKCDICGYDKYAQLKKDLQFIKSGEDEKAYWIIKALNKEITTLYIPNAPIDGYYVRQIENGGFRNCTKLTTVFLSDKVTGIGAGAFSGCSALTTITINTGRIRSQTFNGCTELRTINYIGTTEQWKVAIKGYDWTDNPPSDLTIVCSNGNLDIYGNLKN